MSFQFAQKKGRTLQYHCTGSYWAWQIDMCPLKFIKSIYMYVVFLCNYDSIVLNNFTLEISLHGDVKRSQFFFLYRVPMFEI